MTGEPIERDPHRLGTERINAALRATTSEEFKAVWSDQPAYPFAWGECWRQCLEYRVDDYEAEVGFFTDMVGLRIDVFGRDFVMFTGPDKDFCFGVTPATEENPAVNPASFRLQFMIQDILGTADELERRGIVFEHRPEQCGEGSPMYQGRFRTPNGIAVDLWGMVEVAEEMGVPQLV